ncbi:MAG: LPS export ABC transporter ATP-binding protein [Ignavibacterium album]|uniref:LPS export ABC transporter ATP-binding protein n=1 Tax=Ignavibacterium album TaxID=591197 RepID=UPI0026F17999|nr:LPS export ABC transporter ATP-binding protein [Ignavibacterium album]MCX8106460.1 LPS export ABC transporter ATP-binding protein [Ignavibacterium album]
MSLELKQREVVGLLGPNGAGKTTTFKIITGDIRADGGSIFFNEIDITDFPMYKRARLGIGYLPQEPSAFRGLTTEENIIAVLELNHFTREKIKERLDEVLNEFGMNSRKTIKAKDLSSGEKRRLEVMRAMSLHPFFMLLDEPFAGVDPIAVYDLQQIITKLKEKNVGVLITDHNVHETLEITDRAYIINQGKILLQGTPSEIEQNEIVRRVFLGQIFCLR